MKISILTLGCKVNQSESMLIEGALKRRGHSIVPLADHPDFCVVNTCTVTSKSDYQSRQLIRRALRSAVRVIATGCYVEIQPESVLSLDRSIRIARNRDKIHIINMIDNSCESTTYTCHSTRARPYVKVQDGCNLSCSYCIVPKARGRSVSIPQDEVIEQILALEDRGYREVVLTGIHLGSYGYDLQPKVLLSHLLDAILKRTASIRLRLSSLELHEMTGDIIESLGHERICPHLHLPLQSGDDSILRKMNRQYTVREYRNVVERLMKIAPGVALGTDVIAGFPGEGQHEFNNTMAFLEEMPLAYMHIFTYSPRHGTKASQMTGQVSPCIKRQRHGALNRLNHGKKEIYWQAQIGKSLDIIIEETGEDGTATGTSGNYLRIRVMGNTQAVKSLVSVHVAGREGNLLIGKAMARR
ncbi:MAG: tRNA (N(6)-L-threonylcarbamoyladenosine(37)-C(2))-methylthiotransferase MtaB [Nitrospirota bacterium]